MKTLAKLLISAAVALPTGTALAEPLDVGVAFPTTGPYAFLGVQARKGFDLGVEQMEAAGSPEINFSIEDQTGDKTKVISLVTQFAQRDQVDLILGPIGTAEALAAAPVVNELSVPTYTTAVSTDVLAAGPWSFKMWQDPKVVMDSVSTYMIETGIKSVVIVYMRDGDSYITFKNLVSEALTAGGVEVMAEEPLMSSDTDFSALATKIVGMNPDAIFLGGLPEISANIVIQAHGLGLSDDVRLFGINTLSTPAFADIGGEDVEGTIIPTDYFYATPSPTNEAFVEAYRAKYDEDPDLFAALGYQYTLIAKYAAENGGETPTRDSVREALTGMTELDGVLGQGTYRLDENRQPSYGVTLVRYEDGKLVPVAE